MTYVKNNLRGVIGPNFGIAKADIDASNLTTARSYTLPDSSGQISLNTHSHNYSSLSGLPTLGTAANNLVQLDANAKLPAVDGSQLLNLIDQIARDSAIAAKRIALTAIAMLKNAGGQWGTVFGDEFTDESRISSKTGATFAAGYYHNPPASGGEEKSVQTGTASSGWGGETGADISWSLDAGATVTELGIYSTSSGTKNLYILRRDSSTSYYVERAASISHTGTGWEWVTLGTSFAVPNNGKSYHVGFFSNESNGICGSVTTAYIGSSVSQGQSYSASEGSRAPRPTGARYQGSASSDMTLVSTALTEARPGTVKSMLIGLEYEPIDAIALGTDLKLYSSRDSGTTWTEASYDPATPFLSGKTLVTALVNTASQPSGSNLKWKLTSHNGKQVKIHGVTVYPSME